MGALRESSLTPMATIRAATWDDLEPVFELLDGRSRAAFGTSEMQLALVCADWEVPSFEVGGSRGWYVSHQAQSSSQTGLLSACRIASRASAEPSRAFASIS